MPEFLERGLAKSEQLIKCTKNTYTFDRGRFYLFVNKSDDSATICLVAEDPIFICSLNRFEQFLQIYCLITKEEFVF